MGVSIPPIFLGCSLLFSLFEGVGNKTEEGTKPNRNLTLHSGKELSSLYGRLGGRKEVLSEEPLAAQGPRLSSSIFLRTLPPSALTRETLAFAKLCSSYFLNVSLDQRLMWHNNFLIHTWLIFRLL